MKRAEFLQTVRKEIHYIFARNAIEKELEQHINESIEDMIDGKLICGAGGGGFLQAILKKGVSKDDIHKRLKQVFADNDIDVWNAELI